MHFATLRLKKNEDRRLLFGHLWLYSNEIDVEKTPLTAFSAGQQVVVENASGRPLGVAYVNPHSLICARLVSRDSSQGLDKALFVQRLRDAQALRTRLFAQPYYRLVYGESDNLPGLVIDRYGDVLVAQTNTAGMELLQPELAEALMEVVQPTSILLRNDAAIRELEGLERYKKTLVGEPPEYVELIENDVRFRAALREGQKTGWFYDHRSNRQRLKNYVADKRVLDLFSYSGAWGVQAACWGASEVWCADSSAQALAWLVENASLNQVQNKVQAVHEDVFKLLARLWEEKEFFDVIVLDPPAFIKKRKDLKEGMQAYRRLNQMALRLLNPNGILISASCSLHLDRTILLSMMQEAGIRQSRFVQILEQGHQASDHPVHPAIPETNYLKMFVAAVL